MVVLTGVGLGGVIAPIAGRRLVRRGCIKRQSVPFCLSEFLNDPTLPGAPTLPTTFRYTGQRAETGLGPSGGEGLYYYGARWYDSQLGRFAAPDTVIPGAGNPQAWDRYAGMLNNPVRYRDPLGHKVCDSEDEGDCNGGTRRGVLHFNVRFEGIWTLVNRNAVWAAVDAVASRMAGVLGVDSDEAFNAVFGFVVFAWVSSYTDFQGNRYTSGAITKSTHRIEVASLSRAGGNRTSEMAFIDARNNIVHELGHAFGQNWYQRGGKYDPEGPYANIPYSMLNNEGFYPSPKSASLTWRQHPCQAGDYACSGETFADMFLGWTFDMWGGDGMGSLRDNFMTANMADWWIPDLVGF